MNVALRLKAAVRLFALIGLAAPDFMHLPRSMAQSSLAFQLQTIASIWKGADVQFVTEQRDVEDNRRSQMIIVNLLNLKIWILINACPP